MIGDKTEDGQYYYATAASDHSVTPVLKLDRNWTDTMFGLLDDVPYGEWTDRDSGTTESHLKVANSNNLKRLCRYSVS